MKPAPDQSSAASTVAAPVLRRWSVAELVAAGVARSFDEGPVR